MLYADDRTDKRDEANIGFSRFFFFYERHRKRDLSYVFPQIKNRNKLRNFTPLHLYISLVLPSFIRAYSTFTNSKYGGSIKETLRSSYILRKFPALFSSLSRPITSIFLLKPSAIGPSVSEPQVSS